MTGWLVRLCTGDSSCLRTKPEPDCCPTCSWLPHASAWACSLPGPWASEQAQPTRPREPRKKTTPEVVPRGSPGMPSSRPKGNGRRFAPELPPPSRQTNAFHPGRPSRNSRNASRNAMPQDSTTPLLEAGSCEATVSGSGPLERPGRADPVAGLGVLFQRRRRLPIRPARPTRAAAPGAGTTLATRLLPEPPNSLAPATT